MHQELSRREEVHEKLVSIPLRAVEPVAKQPKILDNVSDPGVATDHFSAPGPFSGRIGPEVADYN
jgi:hypothetical protein